MEILLPIGIVGGLGLVFGLLLAYTSKKFAVDVDPRIAEIRESLPGANCGACGFSGCDAYAEGIIKKDANIELCTVGGNRVAKIIGRIMGVNVKTSNVLNARVMCKGTSKQTENKFKYQGINDCAAASLLYAGPGSCPYACVGMGDCARACQFGAIKIVDGVAVVDEDKCTACGMCINKCPKNIIRLVPEGFVATIRCSNKERGAVARKNCKVSCIACGRCVKACPEGAITIENNLAVIDYDKCTDCSACTNVCPTNAYDRGI